jgi:hypothetical protein
MRERNSGLDWRVKTPVFYLGDLMKTSVRKLPSRFRSLLLVSSTVVATLALAKADMRAQSEANMSTKAASPNPVTSSAVQKPQRVRRVVAGQNSDGRSVIVSDEYLDPVIGSSAAIVSLWGADSPPRFPANGKMPPYQKLFPGVGGYRFLIMTLPPLSVSAPSEADMAKFGPDVRGRMERDAPGMHMTDTVDLEVILFGVATLEFDDGVRIDLAAGDTFVQNGTRHRWSNRGKEPALVAVVMVGGEPRK